MHYRQEADWTHCQTTWAQRGRCKDKGLRETAKGCCGWCSQLLFQKSIESLEVILKQRRKKLQMRLTWIALLEIEIRNIKTLFLCSHTAKMSRDKDKHAQIDWQTSSMKDTKVLSLFHPCQGSWSMGADLPACAHFRWCSTVSIAWVRTAQEWFATTNCEREKGWWDKIAV